MQLEIEALGLGPGRANHPFHSSEVGRLVPDEHTD